jgi:hypothetical protein
MVRRRCLTWCRRLRWRWRLMWSRRLMWSKRLPRRTMVRGMTVRRRVKYRGRQAVGQL